MRNRRRRLQSHSRHELHRISVRELKKRKLVRKTERLKEETEALDKKIERVLYPLSESIEVVTSLDDYVFQMVSSADVKVERKSVELKVKKTGVTTSTINIG